MVYTKRGIFVLSLVLTVIIYLSINLLIYNLQQQFKNINKSNQVISIKIPANTKNGQKIRLKGYGVKNRKSEIYGDMYLIINVILPSIDELDPELKNMLENRL